MKSFSGKLEQLYHTKQILWYLPMDFQKYFRIAVLVLFVLINALTWVR